MQEREHGLDVDQPLLDLAINHAHEIERQIKLHQDRVDHDEIADRQHAGAHVARREQHTDDDADGEDDRLPAIQETKRGIGADRRALVARHRGIETPRLVRLVAEILHRLVVEQAIDRLRMRLCIAFIHVAAYRDAALARPECEPDIQHHSRCHRHHVDPTKVISDQAADHDELDGGGNGVEHRHAHDSVDARNAALDHAVEAAGAPLQMKAHGESVQVAEGAVGERAHCILRNHGKEDVAELREHHHQDTAEPVGDD